MGRIGEMGDRFLIAFASVVSVEQCHAVAMEWRYKRRGQEATHSLVDYCCMGGNDMDGSESRRLEK